MWLRRDGSTFAGGTAVIPIDEESGLALDANGKEIRVYTNQGLNRLNKDRDRRKSRQKRRKEALKQYEQDPRHLEFVKNYGGYITQARRHIATSYDGRIAELLSEFNRLGYLSSAEVTELRSRMDQPAPPTIDNGPKEGHAETEFTEARQSWVGRVGETIEVNVKVVQSVGIRRWWFSQQLLTIMRDSTDNVLVSQGRFRAAPGTRLKIKAKVGGHALQDGVPQTLITSIKALS